MGFPWATITGVAVVAGYALTYHTPAYWPSMYLVANFVLLWLLQLSFYALWSILLYPKLFSPLIGLPEPENLSWINGQYARIAKEPTGMPMMDWINSIPNNGLIRYLGMLNQERVLITSPKALAEVLVTKSYHFQKPYQFRYSIGRILGVGVLLAEGDEHKVQRKNLMPAFAFRHVKDLYPLFWTKSREAVQAMTDQALIDAAKAPEEYSDNIDEKMAQGTAVMEVGNWASRATLDIIGVAGLGRDFGAIKNPDNELNNTYQALFKPSRQARLLGFIGLFVPGFIVNKLPVKRNGDVRQASNFIRSVCADLIREKKEKLARKELSDVDILSVALESGGFSDENLIDQLMTFLAAGHETTASSMTWAIYMLCLNPTVQTRLREEIRAHLPSINDDATSVSSLDIDHMPYLNAVCNEVLRYYGPVPMTLREAACDTEILGQKIPKGTRIMLSPWAVNKSHELWGSDALKFDPDRWMPKFEGDKSAASGGATSNYAFMTFLHGPRSCIGMGFAKAEFACLLAAWVGRFQFELKNKELMDEEKLDIKGGVTARPAKGLHVNVKVVDGW